MGHSYSEAIDTVADYEVGQRVTVWYDPRNPASAVLHRYLSGSNIVARAVGTLVFVAGLVAVLRLVG